MLLMAGANAAGCRELTACWHQRRSRFPIPRANETQHLRAVAGRQPPAYCDYGTPVAIETTGFINQQQPTLGKQRIMIPSMFNGTTIPLLEQVVGSTQARHNVLAGNIANLDTPSYQVRDLSTAEFQQRLKKALEAKKTSQQPISPGDIVDDAPEELQHVANSMKSILFHDGSNVGLEQQVTEISKNQMMHNMAVAIMSSQFQMMQAVIREQP